MANKAEFSLIVCPVCKKINMPIGNKFCSKKCADDHVTPNPELIIVTPEIEKAIEHLEEQKVEADKKAKRW